MSSAFDKLIKKVADKNPMAVSCDGTIKWCPIESPQATYMMGGGIPTARIIRFRGPASSGKSAFCNYLAGQLQKGCPELYNNQNKNKVLYLDFERTFEKRFATSVGVDTSSDKFFQLTFDTIEDMSDGIEDLVKSGEVAAIILDSDAAAPTRTTITDPAGKASFGSRAKALTEFCNKYNILCANYGTTILWISQERSNLNPLARLPTACVTPDTMIEIFEFEEDHISRITMETLFKKAGLENYSTLKVDTFYDISDKKLYTNSYNEKTQKVEKELIEALVYKGKAPIYELVNSNGEIFLKCSGKHRLYDPNTKDYVEVENIESIDALLNTGDIINLKVRKTDAEMPIVDLKVRNNHNYFPNSILSHNTGGEAINYYTSITCRITKTDDIKDATGDVCGIEMRVRNYKNKCSVPFRDANMKLYYDGGFDSNSEYIDFLLLFGMVKQAVAYFKFNHECQDYSLQGRKKLQEWLDTHADVYDSWKKEIIEKISHHNEILDANNQATDENGNEISLDEAKKMGNAVDVADLASQALAAAAGDN